MKLRVWYSENYWLVLILLLATGLRIYHIDFQSLWLDEVLSMNDVNPKLTFKQFYESVLFWEAFPHLYFLLLKYWLYVFGFTSIAARVFSAIIGVFGVYSMYLIGRELFSKRFGLFAATLTAVNIFHIFYSQEVRSYGMLFLFTTLSFYRFVIFLKSANFKNAAFYGIFAGLIVNAHFFGFLIIFTQYLIVLFYLVKMPKNLKTAFFKYSFFAGIISLLLVAPTYKALLNLGNIKSFWVPKPTWDSPILIFKEFFGNSPWLLIFICIIIIHYLMHLIKQKINNKAFAENGSNKLIFYNTILLAWIIVPIVITMIKSYLDLSIMLSRYLIIILPAILTIIAVGIYLIKSKILRYSILFLLIILSLFDLFYIKNYYNTITKTQLREVTNDIKIKNSNNAKIVAVYRTALPFYFQYDENVKLEERTLQDHIQGMKSGAISITPFWFVDLNSRPFMIDSEQQQYLDEYFNLVEKLVYFDTWANYYEPKNKVITKWNDNLINTFSNVVFDNVGNLLLFNNTVNAKSTFFSIKKGSYNLIIKGNSLPIKPINNSNAHIKVKINGKMIGDYFLSENPLNVEKILPFEINEDKQVRIQLIYDNDVFENGSDRNVIIYSIIIAKIKKAN